MNDFVKTSGEGIKKTVLEAKDKITTLAHDSVHEGREYLQDTFDKVSSSGKALTSSATEGLKEVTETARIASEIGVAPGEHKEGSITKAIEYHTSQIPSGTFLTLALGALGLSAICQMRGDDKDANFIGRLVAPILIMGVYNKLVKLEGSEGRNTLSV